MAKDVEFKVNGKDFSKKEFLNALMRTKAGSFIDRDRYKKKIERQRGVLTSLSKEIIRNIKVNQLSGQKLNKVTGKLQESIKYRFTTNQYGLTAEIYSENRLTDLYENGGTGVSIIKAHTEMRTKVFNKTVPLYARYVPEHSRRWTFKALHFMRDETSKMRPKIIQRIAQNIMKD